MFGIREYPFMSDLAKLVSSKATDVFFNPAMLIDRYKRLNGNEYRLIFVILNMVKDTYPFNGILELNLKTVNKYANEEEKFNNNSLLKAIKVLCTAEGVHTPLLVRAEGQKFFINPALAYTPELIEQAEEYTNFKDFLEQPTVQ